MHDPTRSTIDLSDALRALPLRTPPASAWPRLQAELQRRRRRQRMRWALAIAATLLLALVPAVLMQPAPESPAVVVATPAPAVAPDPLQALMDESAQLEALLALTGDDASQQAEFAALNTAYADRLQWIDTMLGSADAPASAQLPLWRERVLLLRRMVGIESGQQMLAAQGDGAASLVATF